MKSSNMSFDAEFNCDFQLRFSFIMCFIVRLAMIFSAYSNCYSQLNCSAFQVFIQELVWYAATHVASSFVDFKYPPSSKLFKIVKQCKRKVNSVIPKPQLAFSNIIFDLKWKVISNLSHYNCLSVCNLRMTFWPTKI